MSQSNFVVEAPTKGSIPAFLDILKFDGHGLLTVVAQDWQTNQVLMVAFANREAMQKTLETGQMYYYSRSRQKLWLKGEESGHFQKVVRLFLDCDGDAVVAKIEQTGAACHLNTRSCFSVEVISAPAKNLFLVKRAEDPPMAPVMMA